LNSNELEYSEEEIDIKVKLRSKLNTNYIKLIGMAKIKMTKLISQTEHQKWFQIFPNECEDAEPIGKINICAHFIEDS